MPWPRFITVQFNTIPGGVNSVTDESLYAPYNTLLDYVLLPQEGFMVAPQYQRSKAGQAIDFTTIFIVEATSTHSPIFYLQIKPRGHYNLMSKRAAADTQTRDLVCTLVDGVAIPHLYDVSALGLRLAFYDYDSFTKRLTPKLITRVLNVLNDTAPKERWSADLLSDEGYERMVALADTVKSMVWSWPQR